MEIKQLLKNLMPDKLYLQIVFYINLKQKLNLDNPKTFNEKLQWLKLYNRKPEYTKMVDKLEVKNFVKKVIGAQYIIDTYGVWDKFEDIDFDSLPKKFVLKCTHDSGGLIICKDKEKLDYVECERRIKASLSNNYFVYGREWPYKNVKPKVFAEEYIEDKKYDVLPVYKFMCFDGEPKIIQTIQNDKQSNESIDYFDLEWKLLDIRQGFPNSQKPYEKPKKLREMIEIARIFSKNHPFLRVDLYVVNDEIKFSEFTFYSDGGFMRFDPPLWDGKLGEWISLPSKYVLKK